MKKLIILLAIISINSFIFVSCSEEENDIYINETNETINTDISYSAIETEISNLINEHRKNIGLNTLSILNIISGVAVGHTNYMLENDVLNHDNFNLRSETLTNNAGAKSVAENVAYGFNSAQGVVNSWLNSEEHKKIIENESYTHFGISTESNIEGRNYFTQIFIKK